MIPSLPRPAWLRTGTVVYALLFFTFLFLPLLVVAAFAFNDAPYPAPPWRGFTLDWFVGGTGPDRIGLFADGPLLASIWTSVVVALWVTLLSVLVGTANAFLLERASFKGKAAMSMLMLAPLHNACRHHRQLRLEITRSGTELLVQSLRAKALDGLVVDARSLKPAPDLRTEFAYQMRGAFMVRRGHPLARRRQALSFEALRVHPIASTPLSDEVARVLVERYGPAAHPDVCVTLRCDELSSLVELARSTDAVLLANRLLWLAGDVDHSGGGR